MTPTFYDTFFAEPMPERQRIAEAAGLSLAYIQKHTYVQGRSPRFHFHNAVGLDHASNGKLSFIETTEGEIDWGYVLDRLKALKKAGVIGKSKSKPLATTHFDRFWAIWPRKDARHTAMLKWNSQGCDKHIEVILADVRRRLQDADWTRERCKYVPHAATYLNQRRWEDESFAEVPAAEGAFAGAL